MRLSVRMTSSLPCADDSRTPWYIYIQSSITDSPPIELYASAQFLVLDPAILMRMIDADDAASTPSTFPTMLNDNKVECLRITFPETRACIGEWLHAT